MKRLLLTLIVLTALSAGAQVKIGNNPTTINSSSLLELESTTKALLPPRMTAVQMNAIVAPVAGNIVYCTDCSPKSLWQFDGIAWAPVGGVPVPTVVANCTGFAGAFAAGVPLTGATYKVTVTNNSFFAASPITFTAGDLTLSGITGLTVGAPTPTPVTLGAGGSQEITYPITGTPAATGTLTGSWSKVTLSCSKTKAVGTLSSVVATDYCTGAALNGNYLNGVAMAATNTFTVTITNNSGFALNNLTAPATANLGLTWTGTGTLSVASVTPSAAFSIANGSSQLITYTLSGTPTSSGMLTADWTYSDLTCQKTRTATDGAATFAASQTQFIVSTSDGTPAVDVQGVINNTTKKMVFKVPYTGGSGSYPAFTGSFVNSAAGQGGDINGFTVDYPGGTFAASGTITVNITLDGDASYNVKKQLFGIQQTIVTLPLTVGGSSTCNLIIKAVGGIPDRRFGETTTQNGIAGTYHNNVYLPVISPATGKRWLNNNLGADYSNMNSPSYNLQQQATSAGDTKAYGSLYQWGRYSDGHELINRATSTSINSVTSASSATDTPANSLFITAYTSGADWRSPHNNTLWQPGTGINNPCPVGFRVPTEAEFQAEMTSTPITNAATAYSSVFKFTVGGWRSNDFGVLTSVGAQGWYWTTTVPAGPDRADAFFITAGSAAFGENEPRAEGNAVRCISE